MSRWTLTVVCLIGLVVAPTGNFAEEGTRGANRVGARLSPGYRQTWALIIGINYEGRNDLTDPADKDRLPLLRNAVNDAPRSGGCPAHLL